MGCLRFLYRKLDCQPIGERIQGLEYRYYLGHNSCVDVEVGRSYNLWLSCGQIWTEMAVCGQQYSLYCS
jgi:hypothetical protein